jgi:hypothetical protein
MAVDNVIPLSEDPQLINEKYIEVADSADLTLQDSSHSYSVYEPTQYTVKGSAINKKVKERDLDEMANIPTL